MGELIPSIVSKGILPLFCSYNGAFSARGMSTLIICYEIASLRSFSGVVGGSCLVCMGLWIEMVDKCWKRYLRIPLLGRRTKFCCKLVSLVFCRVFGTIELLERLRDQVMKFGRWPSLRPPYGL